MREEQARAQQGEQHCRGNEDPTWPGQEAGPNCAALRGTWTHEVKRLQSRGKEPGSLWGFPGLVGDLRVWKSPSKGVCIVCDHPQGQAAAAPKLCPHHILESFGVTLPGKGAFADVIRGLHMRPS